MKWCFGLWVKLFSILAELEGNGVLARERGSVVEGTYCSAITSKPSMEKSDIKHY
jgi:hypothetical protein